MKRLSLIVGGLVASLGAWLLFLWKRGSTFFLRTRGPWDSKRPAIREVDEQRREAQRRRIEEHRRTTEREIRWRADQERDRILDKYGRR